MFIDFHSHIFPDAIAERTMDKLKKIANIEPAFDGTAGGLIDLMCRNEIAGNVILPVVTANRQFNTINKTAALTNELYREKREAFVKKVQKGEEPGNDANEKWLFSFGGIHPDAAGDRDSSNDVLSAGAVQVTDYKEQLKIIKELGLKGIKVHPDYHDVFIDDIRYMRIFDRAAEMGLWIVTHAGWDPMSPELLHCDPDRLLKVLEKIPGERFILAHLGSWRCSDEVEEKLAGKNVWFDTSMTMSTLVNPVYGNTVKYVSGRTEPVGQDRLLRIINKHGSSHLLWGTDAPWEQPSVTVQAWKDLNLPVEDNDAICYKNAMKILFDI